MASTYYDSSDKTVIDGDIAYAADLNDINSAVDTALQQVETDITTVSNNQSYYTDLAQKWAEEVEDTPVTVGHYSALHWAAKAEDQAILADADRVQTNADRVQTGLDAIATAADRVQTGLDKVATAADRVQTDLDKVATAADRVQTGLDAVATAADRVQTGLDVIAAADSASDAALAAAGFPILASGDEGKSLVVSDPYTNGVVVQGNPGPIGLVIIWPLATAPASFLECDGAAVSRTTYAALFAVLGVTYGDGDGSTTFNLPDYRGEFLRGWAHGTTNDPNKATRTDRGDGTTGDNVGTKQTDAFKSHRHTTSVSIGGIIGVSSGGSAAKATGTTNILSDYQGGDESRPRNINVMYCIKYS